MLESLLSLECETDIKQMRPYWLAAWTYLPHGVLALRSNGALLYDMCLELQAMMCSTALT